MGMSRADDDDIHDRRPRGYDENLNSCWMSCLDRVGYFPPPNPKKQQPTGGILHGFDKSTATRRVSLVLLETGTPFKVNPINLMKGEHKSPAVKALHPFCKIPYWQDDEVGTLYESRAIMSYLGHRTHLVPVEAADKARMEQFLSVDYSYFYPAWGVLWAELMVKKLLVDPNYTPDPALVSAKKAELEACLDVMDKQLQETPFLAGGTFTLADASFLPSVANFAPVKYMDLIESRPGLAAWWKRCSNRAAWKAVMAGEAANGSINGWRA